MTCLVRTPWVLLIKTLELGECEYISWKCISESCNSKSESRIKSISIKILEHKKISQFYSYLSLIAQIEYLQWFLLYSPLYFLFILDFLIYKYISIITYYCLYSYYSFPLYPSWILLSSLLDFILELILNKLYNYLLIVLNTLLSIYISVSYM